MNSLKVNSPILLAPSLRNRALSTSQKSPLFNLPSLSTRKDNHYLYSLSNLGFHRLVLFIFELLLCLPYFTQSYLWDSFYTENTASLFILLLCSLLSEFILEIEDGYLGCFLALGYYNYWCYTCSYSCTFLVNAQGSHFGRGYIPASIIAGP